MRNSYTTSFIFSIFVTFSFSMNASGWQDEDELNEMAYWVSRLDSIDSVDDPIVAKIAEFGEPVIPLLVQRLKSCGKKWYTERLSSLGIAYAFKHIKSEKAIVPLLELYLQQEEYKNRFFTPISMILNERKDLCDGLPYEGVDEDRRAVFQSLLSWVVDNEFPDGAEHRKARYDALKRSNEKGGIQISGDFPGPDQEMFRRMNQESVTILAEELTPEYQFTLSDRDVYILNKEQMEKSAELNGDYMYFVFHDIYFYTIKYEETSADMPTPITDKYGVEKIAFVSHTLGWQQSAETRKKIVYLSGGGAATVWIKRNGKWCYVTSLCTWQS